MHDIFMLYTATTTFGDVKSTFNSINNNQFTFEYLLFVFSKYAEQCNTIHCVPSPFYITESFYLLLHVHLFFKFIYFFFIWFSVGALSKETYMCCTRVFSNYEEELLYLFDLKHFF